MNRDAELDLRFSLEIGALPRLQIELAVFDREPIVAQLVGVGGELFGRIGIAEDQDGSKLRGRWSAGPIEVRGGRGGRYRAPAQLPAADGSPVVRSDRGEGVSAVAGDRHGQ